MSIPGKLPPKPMPPGAMMPTKSVGLSSSVRPTALHFKGSQRRVDAFKTPLGEVTIDVEARTAIAKLPQVILDDEPHRQEHSLEVHIPFLQEVLGEFTLLPLVAGSVAGEQVVEVLERLWGDETTGSLSVPISVTSGLRDRAEVGRCHGKSNRINESDCDRPRTSLRSRSGLGHADRCEKARHVGRADRPAIGRHRRQERQGRGVRFLGRLR